MALNKKTGGRKKGTPNKATAAKAAEVAASGLTPLDYMLSVMRAPCPPELLERIETEGLGHEVVSAFADWHAKRMDAAKGAAPYVHPKLAQVEHSTDPNNPPEIKFKSDRDLARHVAFYLAQGMRQKETAHG